VATNVYLRTLETPLTDNVRLQDPTSLGSDRTGSASLTEGADTLSATGALEIAGSASITEGADTLSATGAVAIVGTASLTEGADTLSATGALAIAGADASTEAPDTLTATGALAIQGSASLTEDADTLVAEGSVAGLSPITGEAALTEDPDTLVATATLTDAQQSTGGGGFGGPPVVAERHRRKIEDRKKRERERLEKAVRAAYAQAVGEVVEAMEEAGDEPASVVQLSAEAKTRLARAIQSDVKDEFSVKVSEIRAMIVELERALAEDEDDGELLMLMAA
jgi:hypothetical protein